MMDVSGGNR